MLLLFLLGLAFIAEPALGLLAKDRGGRYQYSAEVPLFVNKMVRCRPAALATGGQRRRAQSVTSAWPFRPPRARCGTPGTRY